MTADAPEGWGDLRCYRVEVEASAPLSRIPNSAPLLRVFAPSEKRARQRARRLVAGCGLETHDAEIIETDVSDYGEHNDSTNADGGSDR